MSDKLKPKLMICPKAKTCKYRCNSMCLGHDKPHKINIDCSESTCPKCVPYAATKPPVKKSMFPMMVVCQEMNSFKIEQESENVYKMSDVCNKNFIEFVTAEIPPIIKALERIIKMMRGSKNEL